MEDNVTNFGYFDRPYFEGMYGEFIFPDGTRPQWESVSYLQKKFMKWFNKERTKTMLTFPVETMSLLYVDGEFVDKEYADFTAEMYAEGHSFFTYISDSPDTLSSCCFSKDQKTLTRSSNGINYMTFEEIYNTKCDEFNKNFTIFHNGSWVKGKVIKLGNRKMYKVITSNNKEFIVSDNHINVTFDGEKETCKLTTDDYLMFNTKELNTINEKDENLTYDLGVDVGRYSYKCANKLICPYTLKKGVGRWVNDDKLNIDALEQSLEFRKGIIDSFFRSGDVICHSLKFAESVEAIITSLGMSSEINVLPSESIKELISVLRMDIKEENVYTIHLYKLDDKKDDEDGKYKWKNNSLYFKIKSIEEVEYNDDIYCFEMSNEDEPYFTLPNGLITHNCRLSNKINENTFSFTNGLTGEATGSKSVITLNYNRIIQNFVREYYNGDRNIWFENKEEFKLKFKEYLIPILERVYKYHTAYNEILWDLYEADMLPVYKANFIHLNKQYLTLGLNGVNEAWMFLNGKCRYYEDYIEFCNLICGTMKEQNALHKTKKTMFNSEFVPAESLGIKNYKWDLEDGYWVPEGRNCFTSYFFLPDDEDVSVLEKFKLHGKDFVSCLDGGSAAHINLKEHLSFEQYRTLLNIAGENGTNYFTYNVKNSSCQDCGFISKHTIDTCPRCGSKNIDYWTRIIGYLVKVKSFNEGRQVEENKRVYN